MSLQLKNHGESWLQEDDSTTKAENNQFTPSTNPQGVPMRRQCHMEQDSTKNYSSNEESYKV